MRLLLVIMLALALAGCESFAPKAVEQGSIVKTQRADGSITTENRSDYGTYVAEIAAARSTPPKAFEFECPATGCNFVKFIAYQTGGQGAQLAPPAAPPKAEHAFVGMTREIKEGILGLAPFALPLGLVNVMGKVVGKVADSFAALGTTIAKSPGVTTTTTNTFPVTGNSNTVAFGGSASSTADNSQHNPSTVSTDSHNTATTNSNNRSATGGNGNPGGGASNGP